MFDESNIQKVQPFLQVGLDQAAKKLSEAKDIPVSLHILNTATSYEPSGSFLCVTVEGNVTGRCFLPIDEEVEFDSDSTTSKDHELEFCSTLTHEIVDFISNLCQGKAEFSSVEIVKDACPSEQLICLTLVLEIGDNMEKRDLIINLSSDSLGIFYECLKRRGDLLRRSKRVPVDEEVYFDVRIESDQEQIFKMTLIDVSNEGIGGMLTSDGRASSLPQSGDILVCERGRYVLRWIVDSSEGGFNVGLEKSSA